MLKNTAFILLTLIAAASASCRKTSIPQEEATVGISFSAGVEQTKGLFTPENFNTAGNTIKVYDLYTAGTHSSIYIDGADAVCDASGLWPLERSYYWTYSGVHSFLSHTSEDGLSGVSVDVDGMSVGWNCSLDNQFDLMYASSVRDLDMEKEEGRNPYRAVELQFNHFFTAVSLHVRNLYTVPGSDIEGFKCYFTRLQTEGSAGLDFEGNLSGPKTSAGESPQFEVSGMTIPQSAGETNVYSLKGEVGEDGFFLVWPHGTPQLQGVALHIEYTVNGYRYTKDIPVYEAATSFNSWESGHRYSYTLSIQDNTIVFEAEVVEWINDDVILE